MTARSALEERRRLILEAAVRVFAAKGYHAAASTISPPRRSTSCWSVTELFFAGLGGERAPA